jgi:hypothetical protein
MRAIFRMLVMSWCALGIAEQPNRAQEDYQRHFSVLLVGFFPVVIVDILQEECP